MSCWHHNISFPSTFLFLCVGSVFVLCRFCFVCLAWFGPFSSCCPAFMYRFCCSPYLCLYHQICSQNLTANSARESTQRPKVWKHVNNFLFWHTHVNKQTLGDTSLCSCFLVLSRSLLSVDETQDVHPEGPSPASSRLYISRSFEVLSRLNENLWTWTKAHTVVIRSSNPHDFRHPDDHWSSQDLQEERQ